MKDGRLRSTTFIVLISLLFLAGIAPVEVRAAVSDYDCSDQIAISEDQCNALLSIYDATGGDAWTVNTNWLETDDPCGWHGVSCLGGTIVGLDLYNNNLTGELPLEIGAFPDLETLSINNNPLTGEVPLTVTFMDLRLFHFHNTGLCEPSDPTFQDWLLGVVYRYSNGTYCTPLATETLAPSGPTSTPAQPTDELPWPQQTLTAMAVVASTEQAVPTLTPTPTKYYTLESPTPIPTETPPPGAGDVQTPVEGQGGALDGLLPDFIAGIPKTWLLLLLIPVALIAVGLLLELRERRKEAEPFDEDEDVSSALFKLDYVDPNEDN
jgi:hypothetical protein